VSTQAFKSYSQNGEDVVLWRALQHVGRGRYIDVGANHPVRYSISMAFYERGWNGITVEPDPGFALMQRTERPRDLMAEVAASSTDGDSVTLFVVDGTGLSTLDRDLSVLHAETGFETHEVAVQTRTLDTLISEAGWEGKDIHFVCIDTEGSEPAVLEGIDLRKWRPWILVVEATAPNSTESTRADWEPAVLEAGYEFCLFDGLSCYYTAEERRDLLAPQLSYPACSLDNYIRLEHWEADERAAKAEVEAREAGERGAEARREVSELTQQAAFWRSQAVSRWSTAVDNTAIEEQLRRELERVRGEYYKLGHLHHLLNEEAVGLRSQVGELYDSTSWRVTKPLRTAGETVRRARSHW
jgi:FkbM family methyltransferase